MAKIVTFLGKPGRPDSKIVLEGLGTWAPGESKVFDDAFADRFGWQNGDDYALFFVTVYNGGQKVPFFTMEDAPPEDTATDSEANPTEQENQ